MAQLTRMQKYAKLREEVAQDKEASLQSEELAKLQKRLDNITNVLSPSPIVPQQEKPEPVVDEQVIEPEQVKPEISEDVSRSEELSQLERIIQQWQQENDFNFDISQEISPVEPEKSIEQQPKEDKQEDPFDFDAILNSIFEESATVPDNRTSNLLEQTKKEVEDYNLNNNQNSLADMTDQLIDQVRHADKSEQIQVSEQVELDEAVPETDEQPLQEKADEQISQGVIEQRDEIKEILSAFENDMPLQDQQQVPQGDDQLDLSDENNEQSPILEETVEQATDEKIEIQLNQAEIPQNEPEQEIAQLVDEIIEEETCEDNKAEVENIAENELIQNEGEEVGTEVTETNISDEMSEESEQENYQASIAEIAKEPSEEATQQNIENSEAGTIVENGSLKEPSEIVDENPLEDSNGFIESQKEAEMIETPIEGAKEESQQVLESETCDQIQQVEQLEEAKCDPETVEDENIENEQTQQENVEMQEEIAEQIVQESSPLQQKEDIVEDQPIIEPINPVEQSVQEDIPERVVEQNIQPEVVEEELDADQISKEQSISSYADMFTGGDDTGWVNNYRDNFESDSKLFDVEENLDEYREVDINDNEEFSNSVSMEISKIMDEITATPSPEKEVEVEDDSKQAQLEHPTIALEDTKEDDVKEIVNLRDIDSQPIRETISQTIPFVVDAQNDQQIEEDEEEQGPNMILNVILIVLIVLLFAVLALIIYYILKTKGII